MLAVGVAVAGLLPKLFLTTFGINDIRGLRSLLLLRFAAIPSNLMGLAAALVEALGGGADIATEIL